MALHDERMNNTAKNKARVEDIFKEETVGGKDMNNEIDILGLDLFIQNDSNSEYLEKFANTLNERVKKEIVEKDVKFENVVLKIDKENVAPYNIAYSVVVLATRTNKSDKVFYHTILLSATGPLPKTVAEIVEEARIRNQFYVLVPADAFDEIMDKAVKAVLTSALNVEVDKLVSTSGVVIPDDVDVETAASKIAGLVQKINISKAAEVAGIVGPVPIRGLVNRFKTYIPKLDITHIAGITKDQTGKVIRSDFMMTLKFTPNNNQNQFPARLNTEYKEFNLVTSTGYMEYLPVEKPLAPGMIKRSIKPNIIINTTDGLKQTTDMVLMSLINSAVFGNPNQLMQMLLNVNRDVGVLNFITNIEDNKKGFGEKLHLKSGKLTEQQVVEIISKMFEAEPVISLEVELYGPGFDKEAPFAYLHLMNDNPALAQRANDYIVKTAEAMVGKSIATKQVAANEGIIVPVGKFVDNEGNVRDVREIDLAFIVENAKDPQIIHNWILSNVPASVSGQDPLRLKIEVINQIVPNAIITGKAIRIPINGVFLTELVNAAMAAGYNPRTQAAIDHNFMVNNDLQLISQAYAEGGIRGINFGTTGFTRPNVTQPSFGFGGGLF